MHLAVGRDDNILHEVGVSTERAAREAVVPVRAAVLTSESPEDHALVAAGRQEDVRVVKGAGDACNPALVTLQRSYPGQSFAQTAGTVDGATQLAQKKHSEFGRALRTPRGARVSDIMWSGG